MMLILEEMYRLHASISAAASKKPEPFPRTTRDRAGECAALSMSSSAEILSHVSPRTALRNRCHGLAPIVVILLAILRERGHAPLLGADRDLEGVVDCVDRGLDAIHTDLDEGSSARLIGVCGS